MHAPLAVLIVDDDESVRRCLSRQFEVQSFKTFEASSGKTALSILGEHPLNAVILDEKMPGLTGIETLRLMRQMPEGRELPILLLTSCMDAYLEKKALHDGADGYLLKFAHSLAVIPDHVKRLLAAREGCTFEIGKYCLRVRDQLVFVDGERVSLPPKETALLFCLAGKFPGVVSWEDIRRVCWPEVDGGCWVKAPAVVSVTVNHLKKRLGVEVESIRGVGLRLVE